MPIVLCNRTCVGALLMGMYSRWPGIELGQFNLLNNSMGQTPSLEANRSSSSQEIPLILWYPQVHYCIHKIPSFVPVMSQINLSSLPIPLLEDPF